MILGKSVHTVHFWFLSIKFILLDSEGVEEGCTLVCTMGDYFDSCDKKTPQVETS